MDYLSQMNVKVRLPLFILILLLHFFSSLSPAQAGTAGEVLAEFDAESLDASTSRWYFDDSLGRHYFLLGSTILKTDRSGNQISEIDLLDAEVNSRVDFFQSMSDAVFVENENTWIGLDENLIDTWTISFDNENNPILTLDSTVDLAIALRPNTTITAIDRQDDDGSWWLWGGNHLYHINATATAVINEWEQLELRDQILGTGSPIFSKSSIAYDEIEGRVYLGGPRVVPAGNTDYFYLVDLDGPPIQLGRFPRIRDTDFRDNGFGRTVGTNAGFMRFWTKSNLSNEPFFSNDFITEYALPEQALPQVTNVTQDLRGVFWVGCDDEGVFPDPVVNFELDIDWGDGSDGYLLDRSGSIFLIELAGSLIDEDPYRGFFARGAGRDELVSSVEVILGNEQLGPIQNLTFEAAGWRGGVPFSPAPADFAANPCDIWGEEFSGDTLKYISEGVSPSQPLDAQLEFAEGVPWLGGKKFGMKNIQASGKAEIATQGNGAYAIGGGGSFLVGSGTLDLRLGGGLTNVMTPQGLEFNGGLVTIGFGGTVSEEAGITEVFPQFIPFRFLPFLGSVFRFIDARAKLTAAISAGMDAKTTAMSSGNGDLTFTGELVTFIALSVGANIEVIKDFAEVTALAEGKAQVVLIPNNFSFTFKEFVLSFMASAKVRLKYLIVSESTVVQIKYPSGGKEASTKVIPLERKGLSGPRYLYESDGNKGVKALDIEPYVITANPFQASSEKMTKASGNPVPYNSEVDVLGGIPTDSTPFSACGPNDTMMIVWAQPRPGNESMQATDLFYTYFDGSSTPIPMPISTDTHADLNPEVAYHHSGVWIAAWERVTNPDLPTTGDPVADNEELIKSIGIAYSIFDPQLGTWTAPEFFDTNGNRPSRPKLSTGPSYNISCLWMESSSDAALPYDFELDQPIAGHGLAWTRFNNGAFDTPGRFSSILDDIIDFDAADSATESRLAILKMESLDFDPNNGATVGDFTIDTMRRTIATQSQYFTMGQQTSQGVGRDTTFAPRVCVDENNNWWVAFNRQTTDTPGIVVTDDFTKIQGSDMTVLLGDDATRDGTPFTPFAPFQRAAFDDFKFGIGKDNQPFIAYKGYDNGMANLKMSVLDGDRIVSNSTLLIDDESLEKRVNLAVDGNGEVIAMYHKNEFQRSPFQMEIDDEMVDLVERTENSTGRLTMTRHQMVRDLVISKAGYRGGVVEAGRPVFIDVEVQSIGDLSTEAPTISVFAISEADNKGSQDMIPISENLALGSDPLPGHTKRLVTVDWTIPDDRQYNIMAIVDPQNTIIEEDENNNESDPTPLKSPKTGSVIFMGDYQIDNELPISDSENYELADFQ